MAKTLPAVARRGEGFSLLKIVGGGLDWFSGAGFGSSLSQIGGVKAVSFVVGLWCVRFTAWFLRPV